MDVPAWAQQYSDARHVAHLPVHAAPPTQLAPLHGVALQQLSYPGGVTPCAQPAELST